MNDLQHRIYTVLKNIGGESSTVDIRTRGGIPKPLEVIEMNLRTMERNEGAVRLRGSVWTIPKSGDATPLQKNTRSGTGKTPKQNNSQRRSRRTTTQVIQEIENVLIKNPGITDGGIAKLAGLSTSAVYRHASQVRQKLFGVTRNPADTGESQVGKLEDEVNQNKLDGAIQNLEAKLNGGQVSAEILDVADYDLKRKTLEQLAKLLDAEISEVLTGISDDIEYLHTLAAERANECEL